MRQVCSDQLSDFSAIHDGDVELVGISRPPMGDFETLTRQMIGRGQGAQLRWKQKPTDAKAVAKVLPDSIEKETQTLLAEQITQAGEIVGGITHCKQVEIRLESVNSPMCPRFHVDYVTCRMLITLIGAGTEWIRNDDVDWRVFENLETMDPPVKTGGSIQHLPTGNWSLLKGGAWDYGFRGVVHRSPHQPGERLLLSLDPVY